MSFIGQSHALADVSRWSIADNETRRLIDGLTTAIATPDTKRAVADAERAALLEIRALSELFLGRSSSASSSEWSRGSIAIQMWIAAAS